MAEGHAVRTALFIPPDPTTVIIAGIITTAIAVYLKYFA
jgi:hypothetical protein